MPNEESKVIDDKGMAHFLGLPSCVICEEEKSEQDISLDFLFNHDGEGIPPKLWDWLAQLKRNIESAWDEASELDLSFDGLSDDELVECREALRDRAQRIMACLHDYAEWKEEG